MSLDRLPQWEHALNPDVEGANNITQVIDVIIGCLRISSGSSDAVSRPLITRVSTPTLKTR